ncbi:MAG TPA: PIG-L deacetylase family protein [Candidatus Saccharimonadales bacterium]
MPDFKPLNPRVVLGIAAHPDDLDFGASGTMAHFAENGADVYYLILTDGSKGSDDKSLSSDELIKIRETEQQAAVEAIGGKGVEFLGYPYAGLEVTMDLKKAIVKVIRKIKPDVVITMDPSMLYSAERGFINHPDHRAAGQAALDAVFPLSRDHLTFPDLYEAGYEPHKTATILLINFEAGNHIINISSTMDKKLAALKAHQSQVDIDRVRPFVTEMATKIGGKAGYEMGEQFVRIDIN